MAKNWFEIIGGFLSSLLTFKGLMLIATGVVGCFVGTAKSTWHVLLDLVFLSVFFLPIILVIMILLTLVITFSVSYPKSNNYKLWIGFGLAAFSVYTFKDFFLGRLDSSNSLYDLILGIVLIMISIMVGRILTSKFINNTSGPDTNLKN